MKNSIYVFLVLLLASCSKSEGEGGNSSISGKVDLEMWNATFTILGYEADAADYDVYIIYGDDTTFSDKTTTDFEGDYSFRFLRPGEYTVYVYSKVNSSQAINGQVPDEEALLQTTTLSNNEDLILDNFTVLDN